MSDLKKLAEELKNYKPTPLSYDLIQQVKEARAKGLNLDLPFEGKPSSERPIAKLAFELRKQANEEQNKLIKKANSFLIALDGLSILRENNE